MSSAYAPKLLECYESMEVERPISSDLIILRLDDEQVSLISNRSERCAECNEFCTFDDILKGCQQIREPDKDWKENKLLRL